MDIISKILPKPTPKTFTEYYPDVVVVGVRLDGAQMREVTWANQNQRVSLNKWCRQWGYPYTKIVAALNSGRDWRSDVLPEFYEKQIRKKARLQRKAEAQRALVGPHYHPDTGLGLTMAIDGICADMDTAASPLSGLPRATKIAILEVLRRTAKRYPEDVDSVLREKALKRTRNLEARLVQESENIAKRVEAAKRLGVKYDPTA